MKQRRLFGALLVLASALSADTVKKDSLYDRLGGKPAVTAVVDGLLKRMIADDRINPWFGHMAEYPDRAAAYKVKLHDFICQAAGGPCKYTGQDMLAAHKDRGVTAIAFQAVVENLVTVLDELQVPEKEKRQLLELLAPLKPAVVQPVAKTDQ